AATPFQGYPVIGGVNQRSVATANVITVNFPSAGTYVYEVDYAKGGDKNLTLSMTAGGVPIPTATVLTLRPGVVPAIAAGQVQVLNIAATDADGIALQNVPVTVNVT